MNILIVDAKSSENYDSKYMESHSLGGTESTVLRMAQALANEHEVYISQINRTERYIEKGITYFHSNESLTQNEFIPDVIIILRKYRLLKDYSLKYPQAKMFVWVHNFQNYDILGRRHWVAKTNAQLICVSQCHKNHINKIFNGSLSWLFRLLTFQFKKISVTCIYNTIDSEFTPNGAHVDKNKLLFYSTPNKGLKEVLTHFKALLKEAPDYKLYIAGTLKEELNSYNLDNNLLQSDSVVILGKIPKTEIISHLRNAFCVFYPQRVHPETFGLIYLEANCVGTPVLAHPFGSITEVIDNKEQLVDTRISRDVVNKLLDWQRNGRPFVTCKKEFLLDNIMKRWREVLGLN